MIKWKGLFSWCCFLVVFSCIAGMPFAYGDGSVKIGILLPLTGPMAEVGKIEKQAFKLAVDKINATGGIHGQKLRLFVKNTASREKVACAAVEKLLKTDRVCLLGGGCSSSVTYAVARLCQKEKVPFLINTAAADKITTAGWDYVFRLNPPFSRYASGLSSLFSRVIRPKTAVVLYEDSAFGKQRARFFTEFCRRYRIRVLMKKGYQYGESNFNPELLRVKDKNPDILYMISHVTDGALLMKQVKDLKLAPKMFVGGTADFTLPAFQEEAGIASRGIIAWTLWHEALPYPGAMNFFEKFEARYTQTTDYHGAEAYAACSVIADALKRTKSLNGAALRQALLTTDMMTVFGPVKFITWGKMKNQNRAPTYVVQWIGGKLEVVWPRNVATRPLLYPVHWLKAWGSPE